MRASSWGASGRSRVASGPAGSAVAAAGRASSTLGTPRRSVGLTGGGGKIDRASANSELRGGGDAEAWLRRARRAGAFPGSVCGAIITLVVSTGRGRTTVFATTTLPAPSAPTAIHFHIAQRPRVVAESVAVADTALVLAAAAAAAARTARRREPLGGRSSFADARSFALSPPEPMKRVGSLTATPRSFASALAGDRRAPRIARGLGAGATRPSLAGDGEGPRFRPSSSLRSRRG